MKIYEWKTDREANTICWQELRREPLRLLSPFPVKVLDIGGGSGDFSSIIYRENNLNLVISIDIDPQFLRKAAMGTIPVNGNILRMPFKNGSFDGVLGRAILHHIPNDLERCFLEISRVLKKGGLVVIQEPCDGNIFANIARRLFKTEIHEEEERPLNQGALLDAMSKHLELVKAKASFFFSYLMPHMTARVKPLRRPFVSLTRFLVVVDRGLMRFKFFKRRSAYLSLVAVKRNNK